MLKKKRLLSLALACFMAMSLFVPSFADDDDDDDDDDADTPRNTTVIEGGYTESEIEVVVPPTGVVVINPYGLGVSVKDSTNKSYNIKGQIMTEPLSIKNQTEMKLQVGATVIAEINPLEGDALPMKLNAASTKGVGNDPEAPGYVAPATGKVAFVQLEAVASTVTSTAGTDTDDTIEDKVIAAYATETNWASSKKVTVSTKSVTEDNLVTLSPATMYAAGDTEVDGQDDSPLAGDFKQFASGSIALFRLSGDCVTSPKNAWTEDDGFKVSVAFTFTPID